MAAAGYTKREKNFILSINHALNIRFHRSLQKDPRGHGYFKTSSLHGHLQGLTGRSLRVDGERELVDEDNNQENQSNGDGRQNNVPAGLGTPLLELGAGTIVRGHRGRESAARAIVALRLVSLEGVGQTDETQKGDDDGGESQEDKSQKDQASEGHAEREDNLVADGVEDEDQQDNSNNEGEDQANQNESLSKLDGGINLGHSSAGVLGAGGGGDVLAGGLALGSDSIEVIEQFAGVENSVGVGGRGRAGGHGVEGGAVRVPSVSKASNGQTEHNCCESDTAKILLLI